MRSILGYFSAYVRSLEIQIEDLKREKSALFDRVLLLTTGAPLEIPKPDLAETSPQRSDKLSALTAKVEDELNHAFPTFAQLLQTKEAESFREDAGIEPETSPANYYRSQTELDEERTTAQESLKKNFKKAFDRASEEYLQGASPVLTPAEQRSAKSN